MLYDIVFQYDYVPTNGPKRQIGYILDTWLDEHIETMGRWLSGFWVRYLGSGSGEMGWLMVTTLLGLCSLPLSVYGLQ